MELNNQQKKLEMAVDNPILMALPNPAVIHYADNYSAVINHQCKQLSVQAFEDLIRKNPVRDNFCWSENLLIDETLRNTKITVTTEEISADFKASIEGLVIVNMGQPLGYGVVTTLPIAAGAVITHYAGKVVKLNVNKQGFEEITSAYNMNYADDYAIDARESANIACFIQDAPTVQQLAEDYLIDPALTEKVAAANIDFKEAIFQGKIIVALSAKRNIQAGELLLINYGRLYWNTRRLLFNLERLLLTQDAQLIPVAAYQYTGGVIKIKYGADSYVQIPRADFIKARQKQQALRYEFTPYNGKKEVRDLSADEVALIMEPALQTTLVDKQPILLKNKLMERLHKEYQLQKLIVPYEKKYQRPYYIKGMSLLNNPAEINYPQAILYLLQALLLAIKQAMREQDIAIVYESLSVAYAGMAKQEKNINYMQAAIYLLKQSIKADATYAKKQRLRADKKWLRQYADLGFYWRSFGANLASYLRRL